MSIIRNSAKCNTCDVELESKHRHDFQVHTCPNKPHSSSSGTEDFDWGVDGGKAYIRRLGEGFTDTSIYER
jgi:hypothetical protein